MGSRSASWKLASHERWKVSHPRAKIARMYETRRPKQRRQVLDKRGQGSRCRQPVARRTHGHRPPPPPTELTEAELNTIGYVVSRYGTLTSNDLINMTHQEAPWLYANAGRQPRGQRELRTLVVGRSRVEAPLGRFMCSWLVRCRGRCLGR
jgi:hypothetical protein